MKTFLLIFIGSFLFIQTQGQKVYHSPIKSNCTHHELKQFYFLQPDLHNQNLQNKYDVKFYWLDLAVTSKSTKISGAAYLLAKTLAPNLDTIALEMSPELTMDSLWVNNRPVGSVNHTDNWLLIPLISFIKKDSMFKIKIFYHGIPESQGFFSGISHAYNNHWKKEVTWTLSEPFAAKDWFPVKQSLTDKADSAWVFLTVDKNEKAGSEGILTAITTLPDGRLRYEWKTHYPIDYYLLSFSVSDYQDYTNYAKPQALPGDSIPIQNYIYNSPGYLSLNKTNLDQTPKLIELYSSLFGLYPFSKEKYGHCLTELGGGMEHQTMTTIGDFGFDLVAHELGHMWFGDHVTCATWNDIWLNEGFATYANYLANEYLKDPQTARNFMVAAQNNAMSQPGGSIYVPESEIYPGNEWRIFNGRLSYNKGAAILHLLRHEINSDSLFFKILKSYQNRFAGSVATAEDFKKVVDSITGTNFTYFFNQWYYGEGYPIYDIRWSQVNDTLQIKSIQTTSVNPSSFFKMFFDVQLNYDDGHDSLIRLEQTDTINLFKIPVKGHVKQIVFDPNRWTLQKVNSVIIDDIRNYEYKPSLTCFPNPVNKLLHVQFNRKTKKPIAVKIYSETGKLMYQTTAGSETITINFSDYPKGIYILSSLIDGQKKVKKIVH